jgi:hypothetical protein
MMIMIIGLIEVCIYMHIYINNYILYIFFLLNLCYNNILICDCLLIIKMKIHLNKNYKILSF